VNEAKFKRRGSASSVFDSADGDEDTKSVASMHELYSSTSKREVSILINKESKDPSLLNKLHCCCNGSISVKLSCLRFLPRVLEEQLL